MCSSYLFCPGDCKPHIHCCCPAKVLSPCKHASDRLRDKETQGRTYQTRHAAEQQHQCMSYFQSFPQRCSHSSPSSWTCTYPSHLVKPQLQLGLAASAQRNRLDVQVARWRAWSCPRGFSLVLPLHRFAPHCQRAKTCWLSSAVTPSTRLTMSSSSEPWKLPTSALRLFALSTLHVDPHRYCLDSTEVVCLVHCVGRLLEVMHPLYV